MPDKKGTDGEPPREKKFISEKIVKQPMTGRQKLKRAVLFAFMAALFGVIAAITFALTAPWVQKFAGGETESESQTISIPKDEDVIPTTEAPRETEEKETTPVSELVQEAMENYHLTLEDVNDIFSNLRMAGQKANKSIVTVHAVKRGTDWFDNPVENTGQYAGAVIAVTDREVLILSSDKAVESADAIYVTLYGGTEIEGTKKQGDSIKGLAVISVKKSDVPKEKIDGLEPFELGNSYSIRAGDMVLAVGAPAGMPYSFDYGMVNYTAKNVQTIDGTTGIIFTNVKGDASAGTFLLNMSGEIIGWVTEEYNYDGQEGITVGEGISDYKGILEKLSNGIPVAYLGVKGQEITEEMAGTGMPEGIYVSEVIAGGPAYNAGIQNGDIIARINGDSILTVKEFQTKTEELAAGQPVDIVIYRNGREIYTEIEYKVNAGER